MSAAPILEEATIPATAGSRSVARRWISRGGFALVDQGLISGSNFFINIILARWLGTEQYGAFALVFAIFLLLTMLYQCLLLEPMAVFGAGTYKSALRGYGRSLLSLHVAISLVVFGILLASALLARAMGAPGGLPGAIAGVGAAAPCILLFWLARRAAYLEAHSGAAAMGAVLYCATILTGLKLIHDRGSLTPFSAFLLMGAGALVAAAYLFVQLLRGLGPGEDGPTVRETWGKHWGYGAWALGGAVASWIPAYIYYPAVGQFTGLGGAGALRAVMNLAAPATQLQAAFSMLLIPYAVRRYSEPGREGALALSRLLTWGGLGAAVAYWLLVIAFRQPLLHLMYAGKYEDSMGLIPAAAVGSIFWTGTFGATTVLRAMERPKMIFWGCAASAVISLLVGLPATWWAGVKGALWGINVSDIAGFFLLKHLVNTPTEAGEGKSSKI